MKADIKISLMVDGEEYASATIDGAALKKIPNATLRDLSVIAAYHKLLEEVIKDLEADAE